MKKVYIFEVKKLLIPLSIFLGIMLIIGAIIVIPSSWISWKQFSVLMGWFIIGVVLGVTLLSFSYNKKRVSADMSYSLPATKRELFVGKYLADITMIFASSILYLLYCLILFMLVEGYAIDNSIESLKNFFACSLIYLATLLPFYHFILLFYYKGNTILDGIAYIGCGVGIVYLVLSVLCMLSDTYFTAKDIFSLFLLGPRDFLMRSADTFYLTYYIICAILGYLILLYLIWFSGRDCSIRTQEISHGIFGYRVFFPIIGLLLPIIASSDYFDSNMIIFFITAIGFFIAFCLYHRSIKFDKISYILLGSILMYNLFYNIIASVI